MLNFDVCFLKPSRERIAQKVLNEPSYEDFYRTGVLEMFINISHFNIFKYTKIKHFSIFG